MDTPAVAAPAGDPRWMRLALSLAARGLGNVWPNPAVGCIIEKDGRVLGRGWTQPGGRPHAETMALVQAGAAARGATAHVTLEPCAHHGRTPPCAEALIAAGVARVVVATGDPDPRVAGRGLKLLQAAGIAVRLGMLGDAARRQQRGFLSRVERGRPMLTLKLATSVDGRIATQAGESQWITAAPARRQVHALRLSHDAVLVGGGTARADDPSLTVRGFGDVAQPVRVVASRGLDLPLDGALVASARRVPLWLCHGPNVDAVRLAAFRDAGADCLEVAEAEGGLDPSAMLQALGARGLTRVFCEGGGQMAAALLRAGLVDVLHEFRAGVALGAEGLPALGPMGLDRLTDAPRFTLRHTGSVGGDVHSIWDRDPAS